MKQIPSLETRTFVILLITALASLYGVLIITSYQNGEYSSLNIYQKTEQENRINSNFFNLASAEPKNIDITTWTEFKDPESNLIFKHPSDWDTTTISYTTNNQLYRISIAPQDNPNPISIYVSQKEYFAMDGLPFEKTKINGNSAITMDKLMLGIKNNGKYFTFHSGQTSEFQTEFENLINTINFK